MSYIIDDKGILKVETNRSGPFTFQIGLDQKKLVGYKTLVDHAYACFASMPRVGEMASQLENIAMVSSIYGTNTIEGGELSEKETENTLQLGDQGSKTISQQRVINLRNAYNLVKKIPSLALSKISYEQRTMARTQGIISLEIHDSMILDLHKKITDGIPHEDNVPGQYRDNPKTRLTKVGNKTHGGEYAPPKCLADVNLLMGAFIEWANSKPVRELPPLYRAPLLHYYFELIHPFWDGNGRTGRIIEAIVLQAARYMLAPYAISKYYLENIDTYYILFNFCRKSASKGQPFPNTEFVKFHLIGMLSTINRLHDNANRIISGLLFEANINNLITNKKINARQQLILSQLNTNPQLGIKNVLSIQNWYKALYRKLTPRTMMRDISNLEELGLLSRTPGGDIRIKYAAQEIELSTYDITSIEYNLPE